MQHEVNPCGAFACAGMNVETVTSVAEIEASGASVVNELAASFRRVAQQHELSAAAVFYGMDGET